MQLFDAPLFSFVKGGKNQKIVQIICDKNSILLMHDLSFFLLFNSLVNVFFFFLMFF